MGCDIHLYIEYKKPSGEYWNHFGKRINPGRNYQMFGILAQVRSDKSFSFETKGIPDDLGFASRDDWFLFISDSKNSDYVTLETAQKYEGYGSKIIYQNNEPTWVEHPDWHTPSWLTLDEYKQAMDFYNGGSQIYSEPEYEAVLAAMQKLSEFDNEVRIVFWFDN